MATGYIPLPAYKYPDNAMIDFKPLERGIDSARQWSQQQENAMLNRKQDARADEDQSMQRTNHANAQTTFGQGQEDRTRDQVAKTALAAYNETDPAKKKLYWNSVIKRHPKLSEYGPEYLSEETGPKLALAEAGLLPDPMSQEKARLGIDLTKSQIERNNAATHKAMTPATPQGAKVPAAVQTSAIQSDQAYNNIVSGLDRLDTLIQKTGGVWAPGKDKEAVLQERRNVQLQLKELYNLGVLNGPDLDLMNSMVFDPEVSATSPSTWPIVAGAIAPRATQSIEQLKAMLTDIRNNKTAVVGMPPISGNPPPGKNMGGPLPAEGRPQVPPQAVRLLMQDPSPEAQQEFEQHFGVSAAQFLQAR